MPKQAIKDVHVRFGAETSGFEKGQKDVNKRLNDNKRLANALDKQFKATFDTKDISLLVQKEEALTKALDASRDKANALEHELNSVNKESEDFDEAAYTKLRVNLAKAETEASKLEKELDKVNKNINAIETEKFDDLSKDMQYAAIQAGVLNKDLEKIDDNIDDINMLSTGMQNLGFSTESVDKAQKGLNKSMVVFDGFLAGTIVLAGLLFKGFGIGIRVTTGLVKVTGELAGGIDELQEGFINMGLVAPESIDAVTTSLIGLSFTTVLAGGTTGGLAKAMVSLQKNMVKNPELFAKMGISIYATNGQMKTLKEIVPEVLTELEAMENGAQKTTLMMGLFGKNFMTINGILAMGVPEFKAMAQSITELIDPNDIAALVEYQANLDKVTLAAKLLALDGFGNVAAKMNEFLATLQESIAAGETQIDSFNDLVQAILPMVTELDRARKTQKDLNEAMEDGEVSTRELRKTARDATDGWVDYRMTVGEVRTEQLKLNQTLEESIDLLVEQQALLSSAPSTSSSGISGSVSSQAQPQVGTQSISNNITVNATINNDADIDALVEKIDRQLGGRYGR